MIPSHTFVSFCMFSFQEFLHTNLPAHEICKLTPWPQQSSASISIISNHLALPMTCIGCQGRPEDVRAPQQQTPDMANLLSFYTPCMDFQVEFDTASWHDIVGQIHWSRLGVWNIPTTSYAHEEHQRKGSDWVLRLKLDCSNIWTHICIHIFYIDLFCLSKVSNTAPQHVQRCDAWKELVRLVCKSRKATSNRAQELSFTMSHNFIPILATQNYVWNFLFRKRCFDLDLNLDKPNSSASQGARSGSASWPVRSSCQHLATPAVPNWQPLPKWNPGSV